ncbi:MAG: L-threonylcarbamoyladenylate synthase [Pseudomonadota bacterium]
MVLSIDRCTSAHLSLSKASTAIKEGGLVAYATETFYGLGCSALNAHAIASIFAAKRRQEHMALPVIIGNIEQLSLLSMDIGLVEQSLMHTFWPAPLSILFKVRPEVPSILTGGTGFVAVRLSPHDGATKLAMAAGVPLVATSANISGRPAVTRASDLDVDLLSGISGYYDEGTNPQGGLPSTLIRCEQGAISILREGGVSRFALEKAGFCLS